MNNIINKKTKISEARQILEEHGLYNLPKWWEIIIFSLLNDCDYIEVVGFGEQTEFIKGIHGTYDR